MNAQVQAYINQYPMEIIDLFGQLRQAVYAGAPREPDEILWARLPSYYVGKSFVRLIPFKDHINIEARAITAHIENLTGYKITPRGMLQIYVKQALPHEVLELIFAQTLG